MSIKFDQVYYKDLNDFVYGKAGKPIHCKNGMVIGGGTVYPEINFTLPPMQITEETFPKVRAQYKEIIEGVCAKAVELNVPGMMVEIELLPPCTFNPQWGIEITKIVREVMADYEANHNLKSVLRLTPVDIREGKDLKHMYRGEHWDNIIATFRGAAEAGADFLSIESVGGKNLHDDAVMNCDLPSAIFALGVIGVHDMKILWDNIVKIAKDADCFPAGDTACGFANTSMVLANKNFIPKVFAAVDRVMSAVRTMVAVEQGAVGPDKDCGYEGVYIKAITGTPISMEGKSAACAHSSTVGNISACLADLWSNESVENVRLLGGMAPVVSLENLAYDCRLMNVASARNQAIALRDMLAESDRKYDPQAYVLDPGVVLRISQEIVKGQNHFQRVKIAASSAIKEIREAYQSGELILADREVRYLDIMEQQLNTIPDDEQQFTENMLKMISKDKFDPDKYDFK